MSSPQDPKKRRPPTVLVVDDEAVVTQSLAAFLELETDYKIIESQSPQAALELLRESPVDLVISDYLMPEMNGLRFLSGVKDLYPDTPRIMLTGYADKENTIRAINEVGLFQYIEKPWDNDQMLLVIKNAIDSKSLRETLAERIRDLDAALLERNRLAERDEFIREELALARRLQQSMLPPRLPDVGDVSFTAKYLPALDIGGDFYDVIPLASGRAAVLVADATGHGIQAALSTAVLKFAFNQFTNCDVTAESIIEEMNKVLFRALPSETFVAATILVIDKTTAECRLINAGLPHPYLLRRPDRQVSKIIANGLMLGAIDNDLYEFEDAKTIQLAPGDLLLVYTDGIGEVEDTEGVQFDEKTMKELLMANADKPGDELANKLVAASKEHAHVDHDWDDITMMGIERS